MKQISITQKQELIDLYKKGIKKAYLSKIFGVSRARITQILAPVDKQHLTRVKKKYKI